MKDTCRTLGTGRILVSRNSLFINVIRRFMDRRPFLNLMTQDYATQRTLTFKITWRIRKSHGSLLYLKYHGLADSVND